MILVLHFWPPVYFWPSDRSAEKSNTPLNAFLFVIMKIFINFDFERPIRFCQTIRKFEVWYQTKILTWKKSDSGRSPDLYRWWTIAIWTAKLLGSRWCFWSLELSENNRFEEINSASERQFNNVIAAVEKVLEDHRLQIEDLYSSVRICPSGSLRFGPQVTFGEILIILYDSYFMTHMIWLILSGACNSFSVLSNGRGRTRSTKSRINLSWTIWKSFSFGHTTKQANSGRFQIN